MYILSSMELYSIPLPGHHCLAWYMPLSLCTLESIQVTHGKHGKKESKLIAPIELLRDLLRNEQFFLDISNLNISYVKSRVSCIYIYQTWWSTRNSTTLRICFGTNDDLRRSKSSEWLYHPNWPRIIYSNHIKSGRGLKKMYENIVTFIPLWTN